MVNKFDKLNDYNAAPYPNESRAAMVVENGEVYYDGVNIITKNPVIGDAVYKKNGNIAFFKGGKSLDHSKLLTDSFTDLGQIIGQENGYAIYLDKTIGSNTKYLDICQYAITAIASSTLAISLKMSPDYSVYTVVNVELSDTEISQENAAIISDAVAAKATEVGDTKDWWAYLDTANNRIIIQCDTCVDYRFYQVSATGCTITHITWEDMPSSDSYFKSNGRLTNYRGLLNIARGSAYWATNGRATAGVTDVWHGNIGVNDNPLTRSAFIATDMFGNGYHQYSTYEDYLRGEFSIMQHQKFGCFALSDAKTLTLKYGNKTAPTKNGEIKYKYPALHYPQTIDRGVDELRAGDLYLNGVKEGVIFMADENMAVINATRKKMGHTLLSNSSYRWFAQRCGVSYAWYFYGPYGYLGYGYVSYGFQVQGVALLKLKS